MVRWRRHDQSFLSSSGFLHPVLYGSVHSLRGARMTVLTSFALTTTAVIAGTTVLKLLSDAVRCFFFFFFVSSDPGTVDRTVRIHRADSGFYCYCSERL